MKPIFKIHRGNARKEGAWIPSEKDIKTLRRLIDHWEFTGDTEEEGRILLAKMKRARNE